MIQRDPGTCQLIRKDMAPDGLLLRLLSGDFVSGTTAHLVPTDLVCVCVYECECLCVCLCACVCVYGGHR